MQRNQGRTTGDDGSLGPFSFVSLSFPVCVCVFTVLDLVLVLTVKLTKSLTLVVVFAVCTITDLIVFCGQWEHLKRT